jgi:hypothetical protein
MPARMAWSKGFWATFSRVSSFAKSNIFIIQSEHVYARESGDVLENGGNRAQLPSYVLDVVFRESMRVLSPFVVQFAILVRPSNVPMNSGSVHRLALRLDRLASLRERHVGNVQNEFAGSCSFQQRNRRRDLVVGRRRISMQPVGFNK